ncbi:uncharacterized protein LOC111868887 isoform X3 [Cryptotermes secundus]|uniref:uncharacterized protein LOC111868887 isoform X3 n=1 Tax=Cryptotermes secundus TaxID=105785 RepID=UPI001454CB87|nr:uncharacterized protein LOC111868887 isoform X3 [Cryptotermes secundus]
MTGNVSCEKKLGIMSDKCHINLNNESSIPPTSEKVTKSTGRKSFCKRRSSCFDSLAVNSGFGNSTNTEGRLGDVGTTNTSAEELMEKLKSEKQAWRSLYEERKQKYRTVKNLLQSRDTSVGRVMGWMARIQFLGGARIFFSMASRPAQAHQASYPMGVGTLFLGVKWLEH